MWSQRERKMDVWLIQRKFSTTKICKLWIWKKILLKNVIDFEKKKELPLTKIELKSHYDAKLCYIYGKRFLKNSLKK